MSEQHRNPHVQLPSTGRCDAYAYAGLPKHKVLIAPTRGPQEKN